MKPQNVHRAAHIVTIISGLTSASERLLRDDVTERVWIKVMRSDGIGKDLAEITIPPIYLAEAIKKYMDLLMLEAESLGLELPITV
jgi:hypothetical protein